MCGIAGLISHHGSDLSATVAAMVQSIRYRGPDDSGAWCDRSAGIAFGHARLSILDLSPEGHQPMLSASGRYVLSYNGEVYNFAELRSELAVVGRTFRGHSDTEVMLAAFEEWGIEKAVQRFVGMFAFALWDRERRTLSLVRDRIGIKPLYFGWAGKTFLFGSELKTFQAYKGFHPEIDRGALTSFMRVGYVPAPLSIYKHVYKLSAGCSLTVGEKELETVEGFSSDPDSLHATWKPVRYWSAKRIAEAGCAAPFKGSEVEAIEHLDGLLRQAVGLRMIADVPLGAFLSGGVDSSLVVALMQAQSSRPVQTFTIGFHEADYNEAIHARKVAEHLRTDHTELYVSPDQAQAVIPRLPAMYDEPFADSSQIPTFLVSELARRHVTVALSGDGGDELFAGYNRYFWGRRLWRYLDRVPPSIRSGLARGIMSLSPATWTRLYERFGRFLPTVAKPGDKLHKLAALLALPDPDTMYLGMISLWKDPTEIVVQGMEPLTSVTDRAHWASLPDFTMRMMYLDLVTYLPDDILVKVDRASMAVGLEARVPLIDHRVVEFAWQIPLPMKIKQEGEGKWLLRQVLSRYVPLKLVERPKMGFGVPIGHWLRGPLREWAEDLLDETRLRREGYFHPAPIRERWTEHLSGQRNWQYPLWNVLMFQAWLRQ
jgi:asparagine synthase (glutamine-hydrolysing)